MVDHNKLPQIIKDHLEKTGYYRLTTEQRVEMNKKCFGSLLRSSKGSSKGENNALRDLRGGNS